MKAFKILATCGAMLAIYVFSLALVNAPKDNKSEVQQPKTKVAYDDSKIRENIYYLKLQYEHTANHYANLIVHLQFMEKHGMADESHHADTANAGSRLRKIGEELSVEINKLKYSLK